MPYVPNTNESWFIRPTSDSSHIHAGPFQADSAGTRKGHRECDAPVVDENVHVDKRYCRMRNLTGFPHSVNAADQVGHRAQVPSRRSWSQA